MAARFKRSNSGVGELLRSEMIKADLVRRAEAIKTAAIGFAPVYLADQDREHYKDSFHVTSTSRGGRRNDRAVAYVTNTAYYARWVEYGTERVPAHHVLLRAAASGGD